MIMKPFLFDQKQKYQISFNINSEVLKQRDWGPVPFVLC